MILSALALALVPPRPQAELLRLKPVVDRRLEFDLAFSIDFSEGGEERGNVDAKARLTERVLDVTGDAITLNRALKVREVTGRG